MKEIITGVPASCGVFSGKVRIIKSLNESDNFNEGDVLVTEYTTPEWMGLLLKAGAVVTANGGMLSHPAIICRELSKPAVVGLTDKIFDLLYNGMEVLIDGCKGKIFKI